MELCYICATGSKPEHLVNARSEPKIDPSNIVTKIYTTGVKARQLPNIYQDNDGKMWSKYYIIHSKQEVWLRDDVYKKFVFGERKVLDVEYVGQADLNSNLADNECGIAAILMLMKFGGFNQNKTVNDFVRELGMDKKTWTTFNHMIQLCNKYGFKPHYHRPYLLTDVLNRIEAGYPVICLNNYNQLFADKFFPHFVVACGYDQEFIYCQDPLNSVKYMNYPLLKFSKAIANIGNAGNNMPYQALSIDYTKEQLDSKNITLLKRIEKLEDQIKLLIEEVKLLKVGRGD